MLTSCLPCIDILMTLDGLPKSTCKYWYLLFILAHQAPMYFPCRVRWSRPRNAAWYLSHCDEAFIWLDRRRPFCNPIGWLQSLPGYKKRKLRFSNLLNNASTGKATCWMIFEENHVPNTFSQLFMIEIASVSNVRVRFKSHWLRLNSLFRLLTFKPLSLVIDRKHLNIQRNVIPLANDIQPNQVKNRKSESNFIIERLNLSIIDTISK